MSEYKTIESQFKGEKARKIHVKATILFILLEESRLLNVRLRSLRIYSERAYKRESRRDAAFWNFLKENNLSLSQVGSKRDLGMKYLTYRKLH